MKKIIYVSALSSERLISDIHEKTGENPGYAVQKFSRLIVKGLQANGIETKAFTSPPINKNYFSKLFIALGSEEENGIKYKYVPFINIPLLKHIYIFIYTFFYMLFWGFRDRKNKAIVCDVLNVSVSFSTLLATKINRVKSIGVVTDIHGMMVGNKKSGFSALKSSLASRLNSWYQKRFNRYILLTEQMNDVVNPKNRPYMIMEALCDSATIQADHTLEKSDPRTILYAGGLHEKYGLKMLVDGFIKSGLKAKLILYGNGPFVEELLRICESHPNIEYRGVAPNEVILEEEYKASLLVNPRFTTEEFTKYSFPSKNMEYMVSGTPLLTTKLPGMPDEYLPHVYLFEDETIESYANALSATLSLPMSELKAKGDSAKRFVLEKKNNVFQSKRIVSFIFN